MHRLHRRDRAQRAEARQVAWADDLRMFDTPAPVALIGVVQFLNRVQHFMIGGVADRVDGDLEIVHRRAAHEITQLRVGDHRQAALARRIGIVRAQPGPARTQCAVEQQLHAAHAQMIVIEPRRRLRPGDQHHIVDAIGIGHDSHAQRAAIRRPAESLPILDAGPHVGNAGDAHSQQRALRLFQCGVAVPGRRGWHDSLDQLHRLVDEDAGRLPARHFDPAAHGRLGRRANACRADRGAIGPAGMAIDPLQPHRHVADGGVQFGGGGEAAQTPLFLIPAGADDPFAAVIGLRIGTDLRLRLRQRSRVRQVERDERQAIAHDMPMRVDQARDHRLAAGVHLERGCLGPFGPRLALFRLFRLIFRFLVPLRQQLFDLAIIVDLQGDKAHDLAIGVERDAVHIVDDAECHGGRRKRDRGDRRQPCRLHARVIRRTSALVSCRLPPSACTSA